MGTATVSLAPLLQARAVALLSLAHFKNSPLTCFLRLLSRGSRLGSLS